MRDGHSKSTRPHQNGPLPDKYRDMAIMESVPLQALMSNPTCHVTCPMDSTLSSLALERAKDDRDLPGRRTDLDFAP